MLNIAKELLNTPSLYPLVHSLDGGVSPVLVSGLAPVHRAALASALAAETGRPLFLLCPDEAAQSALLDDLRAFLQLEPVTLAARELCLISAESASRFEEQKRLRALDAMLRGEAKIVLCTATGLMQRTGPKEAFENAAFALSLGQRVPPEEIERKLIEAGYLRAEQVEGPGQYARRGGILDFFSPAYSEPLRAEFWGDDVDSLAFFNTGSQRRSEPIRSARILPASELLPSTCPGGAKALAEKIRAHAKRLRGHSRRPELERLLRTLDEDAERLGECGHLTCLDRYAALLDARVSTALDYIPPDALVFIDQPGKCTERAAGFEKQQREEVSALIEDGAVSGPLAVFYREFGSCLGVFADFPTVMADTFTVSRYPIEPRAILGLPCKQLPSYGGSLDTAVEDVRHYLSQNYRVVLLTADQRRAEILETRLKEEELRAGVDAALAKLPQPGVCAVSVGALSAGLEVAEARLAVLTDTQLMGAGLKQRTGRVIRKNRQALNSYADLSVGDLVVHEVHGIGRFMGIVKMPVDGVEKDYVKIAYAGKDVLYVPATQLDLVSKYLGAAQDTPVRLSKIGGADWTRAKTRAKAAAREMAKELIALYAARSRLKGYAFSPDSPWQTEFENSFGYVETDDQLRCVREIKRDMESDSPMDRLLCGDVGYGKTEVALRAVMKCVLDGKQAAMLVPTTVLAQQHYQTAVSRFFGYPIKIEVLSRFRSPAQIKEALLGLKTGEVDIAIGTHRLLQKDVVFKDLGLLVVDEEQRFGVSHKERLKEMSRSVDALTLSATPIPRTLNMALSSIRDMSTIEEPPLDRLPVQTYVMEHDWDTLCEAIRREVQRGGQVYYLHNRIETIDRTAYRLSEMLEGVSLGVAHGRMAEDELSQMMDSVSSGECQVLVCTTIIETGIDIPNVNTLIIEDADKLGLAQLHQIRGRVGRSSRRAFAYLTFRKDKVLTEIAEKRLSAIREFAEFNSGFKIAMRDLEIRGAGNLLGAEQSGHMIDVGYDMYVKLLREAVLEERGEKPEVRAECSADLSVAANIPEKYVPSDKQRMDLYRRIALIRTE
ncbi:MAG: transcription-repair coupling factor, partial [Firmicutes bacterium]|nr:transcription-repair coupling factor [Bacillota bacterium]